MFKLRSKLLPVVMALAVALGFSFNAFGDGHKGMKVPSIKSSVLMSGLDGPWDMGFLGDGTMFFTEKCKGLSVRTKDGNINKLFGMKGSTGYADSANDLFCSGQAGMLGVVADINFAKNRALYVYSSSTKSSAYKDIL